MRDIIYVAGHGKLASKIHTDLKKIAQGQDLLIEDVINWDHHSSGNADTSRVLCIHAGSGKQYQEMLSYCQNNHTPLFQCSTGIIYPEELFIDIPFIFVDAPNFSVMIVKFLYMLEELGSIFHEYDISVIESHQSAKTSLPGTAREMAKSLAVGPESIKSIRDTEIQQNKFEIPEEHLGLHALHVIDIGTDDCRITFKTQVYGLNPYLVGMAKLLRNIDMLSPGKYTITDLVRKRII